MDFSFPIVTFIFCQAILIRQFVHVRLKIAWQKIKVTIGKKKSIDFLGQPGNFDSLNYYLLEEKNSQIFHNRLQRVTMNE